MTVVVEKQTGGFLRRKRLQDVAFAGPMSELIVEHRCVLYKCVLRSTSCCAVAPKGALVRPDIMRVLTS